MALHVGVKDGDIVDVAALQARQDRANRLLSILEDRQNSITEQAQRQDLKTFFLQRADDCRAGAQELGALIRDCGGRMEDGGSAMGAVHRGWVAVKATLSTYDDKAVLEEAERGEDNAKTRYRKALEKPLPGNVRQVVERQMQGVQRNHDQVKALRDQLRAA